MLIKEPLNVNELALIHAYSGGEGGIRTRAPLVGSASYRFFIAEGAQIATVAPTAWPILPHSLLERPAVGQHLFSP